MRVKRKARENFEELVAIVSLKLLFCLLLDNLFIV